MAMYSTQKTCLLLSLCVSVWNAGRCFSKSQYRYHWLDKPIPGCFINLTSRCCLLLVDTLRGTDTHGNEKHLPNLFRRRGLTILYLYNSIYNYNLLSSSPKLGWKKKTNSTVAYAIFLTSPLLPSSLFTAAPSTMLHAFPKVNSDSSRMAKPRSDQPEW